MSIWYERVNTASNIADLPSRGDVSSECLGVKVEFDWLAFCGRHARKMARG